MSRRKIEVIIAGDATGLNRAFDQADGAARSFGSKFASIATGITGAVAGAFAVDRLLDFGGQLLQLGTATEVFRRKAATVFEGANADVQRWADANAAAFGVTDDQLAGLAANFGDLLKPMGFTADQAAAMSKDVVGLSGALSAWSGGTRSAAEVSEILAKAMLGERDSLKELGISISEADVQARLAAKGQEKLTGAALAQAKAVATQELIFEKSTDAQRAWADGSMDAIKNQNALKEKLAELKETLAEKLTPAFQAITGFAVNTLVPAFEKIGRAFGLVLGDDGAQGFGEVMDNALGNSGRLVGAFRTIGDGIRDVVFGFRAFFAAMRDGDVTSDGFVGAMEQLGAWFHRNWPTIKAVAETIGRTLVEAFQRAIGVVREITGWMIRNREVVATVGSAVVAFVAAWKTVAAIQTAINAIKAARAAMLALNTSMMANPVGLVVAGIVALGAALYAAYRNFEPFRNVVDAVGRALRDGFGAAVDFVVAVFTGKWGGLIDWIKGVPGLLWNGLKVGFELVKKGVGLYVDHYVGFWLALPGRIIDGLKTFGSVVWDGVVAGFNWIRDRIADAVTAYVDFYLALPGRIVTALAAIGTTVWNGVRGGFDFIRTQAGSIVDRIVEFFAALPGRLVGLAGAVGGAALELGGTILSKVGEGLTGVAGFAADVGKAIANAAIRFVNTKIIDNINRALDFTIDPPGPGPKIRINPPDIPHIPQLAQGAIVTRPTLALVGEDARTTPEIVSPEQLMRQIVREESAAGTPIYVAIQTLDPQAAAPALISALREIERRTGQRLFASAV